jgi:ABC-type nickel/cobalt efflux system permease component RcnA
MLRTMKIVFGLVLSLLLIGQAQAHNPGLSTADIQLATNGVGVSIIFAPSDLEQLLAHSPVSALETQVCVLAADGVALAPIKGGLQTNTADDLRFAFVFPPVTSGQLRVECPLLRQLPAAHRQYLTIREANGELLAERLLQSTAADYSIDVTPPPAKTTLPKFVAVGQKRVLTLVERLALLGAVLIWGAGHALTPGHGKSIVAAYLVGSRSTPWHAVVLGLTVTATHTLGVFILGIVTLFAAERVPTERLYPWLAAASGLIVAVMGAVMFVRRLHGARNHDHHHDHHGHHHHDHDGYQHHDHDGVHHDHHDHDHGHEHPSDGTVTWRQLFGLGVSGGLLPCPAALVLLLASFALQRTAFGLLLVLTFSIGIAGVLTLVGLLFVKGRRVLDRLPSFGRLSQLLPVVSAALIFLLGVLLCAHAFPR